VRPPLSLAPPDPDPSADALSSSYAVPRMTPILRNRHEKVQESSINLIGRIADRGAEFVSAREWMRICFELLDLLKAHKKAIRRAAVNSFGYIAKAIGPQDVLSVLLTNLKVQDRQSRVCSTVAIGASPSLSRFLPPSRTMTDARSHPSHSHRRRDLRSVHVHPGRPQRVPHARAQRAQRLPQGALVPVRVHRRDGQGLHPQRPHLPRGRSHRPRPGPPADGRLDRQAPRARHRRSRCRGRQPAPTQPHLAQHLRECVPPPPPPLLLALRARADPRLPPCSFAACHQLDARRHRGDARRARAGHRPAARPPGPLPPGAQGPRGASRSLSLSLPLSLSSSC